MNIVAIADTHGFHHQVKCPAGDVLLVAGDICSFGTLEEVKELAVTSLKNVGMLE